MLLLGFAAHAAPDPAVVRQLAAEESDDKIAAIRKLALTAEPEAQALLQQLADGALKDDKGEEITLNDLLADFSFNPETDLDRKSTADYLYRAMEKLSEDERDIIVAVEIEGYTFAELADQWDESINTLLSRKSRGMAKLKKILEKQEGYK